MGVSKNTVKAALRSEGPPKYERPSRGSVVDEVEPRIRELLQAFPTMPATVIAERIGWGRSIRVLGTGWRELRPVYLPPDPASRTAYVAGEIAQFDLWFPPITLPVGFGQTRTPTQLPVLTMVCGYSRSAAAVLIPSRTAEDLMAGWWQLLAALGAVPRVLVWDGEGAVGRWRGGRSELTAECHAFRGTLAPRCSSAGRPTPRPRAWSSGSTTTWSARSCPAARSPARPTSTPRSRGWLALVNTRPRRALGCAPTDRLAADLAAMLPLPPVAPVTGWRTSTRLAARPLRAPGQQRLLGPPGRDRPAGRGGRGPASGSGCSATAARSPTTSASGPSTRPSPPPSTSPRRGRCAPSGAGCCARPPADRGGDRALSDYDTALGRRPTRGRGMSRHQTSTGPGPDR